MIGASHDAKVAAAVENPTYFRKSRREVLEFSSVSSSPSTMRSSTYSIHIENKCHKTIWVGILYKPTDDEQNWIATGWWKLHHREIKHIANTKNRIVYLTAYSTDGTATWGDSISWEIEGQKKMFFKREISASHQGSKYTVPFTCST